VKAKTKKNIKKAISLLILAVLASMAFIPLYWMVATAFTQPSLTMKFPPDVIPKKPTLQNFSDLFERSIIFRWTFNSFIVAGTVTFAQIFVCAMAGYSLAKKRFPGSKALFSIYIASMMIPTQVTLVPLYILISKMGMIDTYQALILPARLPSEFF
jgi:multiple sugar transport system permease protein